MMKKILLLLVMCVVLLSGCETGTSQTSSPPQESSTPVPSALENKPSQSPSDKTDSAPPVPAGDTVEIKEKLFIARLNDVYLNQDDYLGKTIKLEGMFTQYTWDEKGMTYYLVYRNSPGCCGADGQAGFEVIWPEDSNQTYPNENDWVESVGVLEEYENDGIQYLRLALSSLTVLQIRGAEFVSQ